MLTLLNREEGSRFDDALLNPLSSQDALSTSLLGELIGNPEENLRHLTSTRLDNLPYSDIFTLEFQVFRLGKLGLGIKIPQELRMQYAIEEEALETIGPDHDSHLDDEDLRAGMDFYTGMNLVRAFIASYFIDKAHLEKKLLPQIKSNLIDIQAIPRDLLTKAKSSRKGTFVYDADTTLSQWQRDDSPLFSATSTLIEDLSVQFTPRLLRMYRHLPREVLRSLETEVFKQWMRELLLNGTRTYSWFRNEYPELIEVPVIKDEEKITRIY